MKAIVQIYRPVVAALFLILGFSVIGGAALAQSQALDELFADLKDPNGNWVQVEQEIWQEWGKSGSDAMDLLLERGRAAMQAGEMDKAIEHLTALTDHAPDFAEGWNARATAFFMADEYGLSVNDIQKTLVLNPRHFGALSGLGMIFERLEQNDKALKAYEAALAVHPHRPNLIEAVKRLKEATMGTEL